MSLLDANPTRIVPFREVCDVNAFKISTSLIITGVELPGQLAAEANCKIAFKIACLPMFARAKEFSLELRLSRSSQGVLARDKDCVHTKTWKSVFLARAKDSSLEPRH